MDGSQDGIEFFTGGQAPPKLVVPAQRTGASGNEITNTGKTGKGEGMGTGGDTQARHLRHPSSDKSGLRVITIAHTIVEARADGNDILERSAQFDAHEIVGRVDTKVNGVKDGASTYRYLFFVGCHNNSGWFLFSYLARNTGSAECRNTRAGLRKLFSDDLGHTLEAVDLNALAGTHKQGLFPNIGGKQSHILTHTLRWRHK